MYTMRRAQLPSNASTTGSFRYHINMKPRVVDTLVASGSVGDDSSLMSLSPSWDMHCHHNDKNARERNKGIVGTAGSLIKMSSCPVATEIRS